MRPMPGSARMYPETDIKPIINFDPSEIDIPKTLDEQAEDMVKKYAISLDMAKFMLDSDYSSSFFDFSKKYINLKPAFIAQTMIGIDKDVKAQFGRDIVPSVSDFEIVFNALDRKIIAKESLVQIFSRLGEKMTSELVKEYTLMNDSELEIKLKEIVATNPDAKLNVLMGIAMKELRGKASGEKISERLKVLLGA
jgi:glutamyl-tRNA(Gln) amidotransferase subunit E